MLKITAPFKEKEEVIPLIESGADELYCGYLPREWKERYTSLEFERKGSASNVTDLASLREAVLLAHQRSVPVYIALNGLYVRDQYPTLLKAVADLNEIDLDGFIVADIGLLLTLRKLKFNKKLHISTGGTVFNSEAALFFQNLGADRIILDRQVTIADMKVLARACPGIDFEVFILNTLCVYIDGFCTFMHTYGVRGREIVHQQTWEKDEALNICTTYDPRAERDACCLKYSIRTYENGVAKRSGVHKIRPVFFKQSVDCVECGACALYDINDSGVKSVKIVGRQMRPDVRLRDTKFIRSCLDILEDNRGISRGDFVSKAQELYRKTYKYDKVCRGNNCYHPEVLYDN